MKYALVYVNAEFPKFAVRSRSALDKIVKKEYPAFKRMPRKEHINERYYEDDGCGFIRANFNLHTMIEVRP